jgi:hypothetical protein
MQRLTWLRLGIGAVLFVGGGAAAFVAGCGGDDTSAAPGTDAGNDDATLSDSGGGAEDGGLARGKVIVVHASPDVPAVRFCFGTGNNDDGSDTQVGPLPALPHLSRPGQPFPGIFPGTGSPLPDITDLSQRAVTGFVILAEKIVGDNGDAGTERDCPALLGANGQGGALTKLVDYFQLATIPKGTFANGTTTLIAATGCFPKALDPSASANLCGADFNELTGNLSGRLFKLDRVTQAGTLGAQVLQVSPSLDAESDGGTGLTTGFLAADGGPLADGGPIVITTGQKYGELKPDQAAQNAGIASNAENVAFFTAVGATATPLPLPIITQLTTGAADTQLDGGPYYQDNMNYTFVVLGVPGQPLTVDGGVNGHALHYLAFPNDPQLPPLE